MIIAITFPVCSNFFEKKQEIWHFGVLTAIRNSPLWTSEQNSSSEKSGKQRASPGNFATPAQGLGNFGQ
jgi:hypothetical protein